MLCLAPQLGEINAVRVFPWFAAQRCYVHKTCFQENRKDTKVVCPIMWTYDLCALDTGT